MFPIRTSILHPDDIPSEKKIASGEYKLRASELSELEAVSLEIWQTEGLIEGYELRTELDGPRFKPSWKKEDRDAWQETLQERIRELENTLQALRERYEALRAAC